MIIQNRWVATGLHRLKDYFNHPYSNMLVDPILRWLTPTTGSIAAPRPIDQGIPDPFADCKKPLTLSEAETIYAISIAMQQKLWKSVLSQRQHRARSIFLIQRSGAAFRQLPFVNSDFTLNNQDPENLDLFQVLYAQITLKQMTTFFRYPDAFATFKRAARQSIQSMVKARIASKTQAGPLFRVLVVGASTNEEVYTLALILAELLQEQWVRSKPLQGLLKGPITLSDWIHIDAVDDYSHIKTHYADLVDEGTYPAFLCEEIPSATLAFALQYGYLGQSADTLQIGTTLRSVVTMHDIKMQTENCHLHPVFSTPYHTVSCNKTLGYLSDVADTPAKAQQVQAIIDLIDGGSLLAPGGLYITDELHIRATHEQLKAAAVRLLANQEPPPYLTVKVGHIDHKLFTCLTPAEQQKICAVYQKWPLRR